MERISESRSPVELVIEYAVKAVDYRARGGLSALTMAHRYRQAANLLMAEDWYQEAQQVGVGSAACGLGNG